MRKSKTLHSHQIVVQASCMPNKKILVISDMHVPYHHKDSINFLKAIKKEFKPDRIINIGDLLDFHAINMHTHDPDLYSFLIEANLVEKSEPKEQA